ncbi:MAG: hypothetical protein NBV68_05835 [Erythrobacter sp.]|uniref:hypothetical protein n=1 Tax=Erythrobacter sp. TaxID=1042 RepID=UPI0025D4AA71|nr:hypothetical protein [Erythrobacter sp.]MCL9998881.1 hypothetical protein [Erythrobacter sp.]
MAALPKLFLPAVIAAAVLGSSANAQEDPSALVRAMEGATTCVLAAGKKGADRSKFDGSAEWEKQDDGSYLAAKGLPVKVTFPADPDGVSRICVVEATLPSPDQQKQMRTAFEVLLKKKPIEQKDSLVWMFGGGSNARGLQFFTDNSSDQPKIRLIGAAF